MSDETQLIDPPAEPAVAGYHIANDAIRASWNFSQDAIRANTCHFAPDEQDALIALFRWCTDPDHRVHRADAAARLKCSPELIYQLLTGKYRNPDKTLKGPSAEFMANLKNFLAEEARKFHELTNDFVLTPTAKKIVTACDLARESNTPVILWGPSQIGKTWTLRYYAAHHNHGRTGMAELKADGGYGGMIRTLAKASGVPDGIEKSAAQLTRIKFAHNRNSLLIIDEMHQLEHAHQRKVTVKAVETIRGIHDTCGCGMVLCWSEIAGLRSLSDSELVQIWRRGVHKVALPIMPTKADLKAILEHNGLDFPDRKLQVKVGGVIETPYEILRQQALNNGLKAITERIRYARKLAVKNNDPVNWTHFADAHLRIAKQAEQEGVWN